MLVGIGRRRRLPGSNGSMLTVVRYGDKSFEDKSLMGASSKNKSVGVGS